GSMDRVLLRPEEYRTGNREHALHGHRADRRAGPVNASRLHGQGDRTELAGTHRLFRRPRVAHCYRCRGGAWPLRAPRRRPAIRKDGPGLGTTEKNLAAFSALGGGVLRVPVWDRGWQGT